ncbi:hypothetical protein [Streptomyces sp. NPDC097619]|uniref:hypothetical protein n=1 Tax=Streptomyces sp. NPDC097619 TaxID=3157228 RepID=UPI003324C63F
MNGQKTPAPGAVPAAPVAVPDPSELLEIAYEVGRDFPRWRARVTEAEGEGSWVQLFRSGHLRVWAVAWDRLPPGTCYLSHERIRGAVYVARGTLVHERARLGDPPHTTRVPAGSGFSFDETFYHRMHPPTGTGPTVSVHAFTPDLPPGLRD